jgi:cytochrome c oxidase subunit I+III
VTVTTREARTRPEPAGKDSDGPSAAERIRQTWADPPGFGGWLIAVQNGAVGGRFVCTAFLFFLVAGVQALLIRTQLARPENTFLSAQVFNELFTMHGTTMMFIFAVPIMEAFAILVLPSMLGTREMPFPRMSSFGYWSYALGALLFYFSFVVGAVPDGGWFGYVPLTNATYSPGLAIDFWLLGLSVAEVAALGAGVELTVSVLKVRAPGMTISRLPLYAWSVLVMALSIIVAFTVFLVATMLLELDRKFGTHFFNPAGGGDPLLYQHLFWIFGHPEVYIQFIPAAGMVSMIVPTFARRPILGYTLVALSVVATSLISFGLWVHHMFTTGLALLAFGLFAGASMSIAIPSGIQMFAWLGTIWSGRPVIKTPFLFVIGFILIFVLGGLTGVMVASVPFNLQVHDTYFVVAHFHYVLIGGVVFPIFAALYYWMPIIAGRLLSERLGRWSFGLIFVGFNVAFLPMHVSGLLGMPRRYYTYQAGLGLDGLNLTSTIGAFVMAAGVAVFVWDVVWSVFLKRGEQAPDNPWGTGTLDFAAGSPPPDEGYLRLPVVTSRYPLWQQDRLDRGDPRHERLVRGLAESPTTWRATVVVSVLDGEPQSIARMNTPSWWPLGFACGLVAVFAATLFDQTVVAGLSLLVCVVSVAGWFWPSKEEREIGELAEDGTIHGLPVYANGSLAVGWWGMLLTLLIFVVALGSLIYSYFYLRLAVTDWPPPGVPDPPLLLPVVNVGVLLASAGVMLWAVRSIRAGRQERLRAGLAASFLLNVAFVGLQLFESSRLGFGWTDHAYGSIFTTTAGTMTLMVGGALFMAAYLQVHAWLGYFTARRYLAIENLAMYTSVAAGAWVLVAAVLYLSPRLI